MNSRRVKQAPLHEFLRCRAHIPRRYASIKLDLIFNLL